MSIFQLMTTVVMILVASVATAAIIDDHPIMTDDDNDGYWPPIIKQYLSSTTMIPSTSTADLPIIIDKQRKKPNRLRHNRGNGRKRQRKQQNKNDNQKIFDDTIADEQAQHRQFLIDDLMMIDNDQHKISTRQRFDSSIREKNEPLCATDRKTMHMNTPTDEYDPPFIVEIRCKNIAEFERNRSIKQLQSQTCVHDLLRCVQIYKDVHFSRRRIGSHLWHPFTKENVPIACDCMWPIEKYGPQHRDEL